METVNFFFLLNLEMKMILRLDQREMEDPQGRSCHPPPCEGLTREETSEVPRGRPGGSLADGRAEAGSSAMSWDEGHCTCAAALTRPQKMRKHSYAS